MSRTSGTLSWGCFVCALAAVGCAPGASTTLDRGLGDAGNPAIALSPSHERSSPSPERIATSAMRVRYEVASPTPAPVVVVQSARAVAPSGARCRVDTPPGDCDRCPDRACRQVYVVGAASDGEWASFCDQGRISEEARIACLCAGGHQVACDHASQQTAGALVLLTHVFSGRVPPVGTRYRDEYGLREYVDQEMHDWLEAVSSAPATLRCDTPDRDAAEASYAERSQRVRLTGRCDE